MSYELEMYTADGKYRIKDGEGNVVDNGPLSMDDALQALAALVNPKKKTNKKKKQKKEKKNDGEEE
tara:strand:- start:2289 stop:2486 length:198 start_codon:yes stop_codon:yes gene_type:complete